MSDRPGAPALPKRFYTLADVADRDGRWALLLDGRGAKTPARQPLSLASQPAARALAEEWQAQGEVIDPAAMPLTRIVNAGLDGVAPAIDAVVDDIVKYAGSDLLCYRADGPQALIAAQDAAWNPVLAWAREALGARFILAEGVMFVAQPPQALEAVRRALDDLREPVVLAALHVLTTVSGSALLALAVAKGALNAPAAWAAAHVDERHQEETWGADAEAAARRAARENDFMAAARLIALHGETAA